jgi:hypothetical protein
VDEMSGGDSGRVITPDKFHIDEPASMESRHSYLVRSIQAPGLANSAHISGQRSLVAYRSSSDILGFSASGR